MIRHHPSEATLIAEAAGTLPALHARVLGVHLAVCPQCRGALHGMEDIGGALLADLPPAPLQADALTRALARLDTAQPAPPAAAAPGPPGDANGGPATLIAALATGRWRWLGPGIRLMPLVRRDASGTRLDLIRVSPGIALPGHGHTGAEMACILQGGYADATGEYNVYDVAEGDPTLQHAPVAAAGTGCICLTATTGRLLADTWLARLVQPLIGV